MHTYNCSKIIDYIILFKLILHNKNLYFPNIFYKEWAMYLIPTIKNNYCRINEVTPRYNFKDNFIKILSRLHKTENTYFSLLSKKTYFDNIEIIKIDISLFNSLFYNKINSFIFELEYYIIDKIKLEMSWTFKKFDILIENLWEKSYALFMDDYMSSNSLKKIIYYYIFKKIILRIIQPFQMHNQTRLHLQNQTH